ncbi:MAG TPA: sugar phosphate isomerase/epimerase [Firmicutes bacterium]|nr:sugar phosphate isomerase/epimerase [Bacillota bacterium]
MARFKLAIMQSNLRMDHQAAFRKAAEMGVDGIHLSVNHPALKPENLDAAGRKNLLAELKALNLEVSAISSWGGRVDLGDKNTQEVALSDAYRTLELAVDLESGIWQAHIGVVPHDKSQPRWDTFIDSLSKIGRRAEELGACLAIETGPEPPALLRELIETVGSPGIKVNYDPANLILWPVILAERGVMPYDREKAMATFQPVEGVNILGPYIVHTHAKDATVLEGDKRQEVPLGEGLVDWPRYLDLLEKAGYKGYLAIEREVGPDPVGDIQKAVDFLRSVI